MILALTPAQARDLWVGPTRALKLPSHAAMVAQDGDRVLIDPGTYADCAIWRASRLTIAATGPDVIIAGPPCEDRGLFITLGRDITIRGITFVDGRVVYHNGAGVRAFGANLTVEKCQFRNNENGILAGGPPSSVVRIRDSVFEGNGSCAGACAHGVYAGTPIAILDIENSIFRDTRIAHHIKSRARTTVVAANQIEDGTAGTSSYLVETPNGGNLLVLDNVMQKGRLSDNPEVAISIGVEGTTNPGSTVIVQGNRFTSDLTAQVIFVRNASPVPALLRDNVLKGNVVPLTGPGVVEP